MLSRVSNCSVPHNILTETNSDVLQQSLELALQPEWCNLAVTVMRVQIQSESNLNRADKLIENSPAHSSYLYLFICIIREPGINFLTAFFISLFALVLNGNRILLYCFT